MGYVAGSLALGALDSGFGPLWLAGSRLLVAGALLGLLVRWRGIAVPTDLRSVIGSGLLAWVGGTGMLTIGQQWVPAGTTALVLAGSPAVAVLLDAVWRRRAPGPVAVAALVGATTGLVFLLGPAPLAVPGIGWTLAATVAWAAAQVVESKRPHEADPLAVSAVQVFAGGVGLVVLALLTREALPVPGAVAWSGWLWLVGPCTVLGLPAWLWVLRRLPVHVSMLQATLSPVVAVALSASLGWESLGPRQVFGVVLVLVATGFATRGSRPSSPAADSAPSGSEAVPAVVSRPCATR